jgi:DNA-binding XRE family transcriptional regulator
MRTLPLSLEISGALKNMRIKASLTQEQLAILTDTHQEGIARLESGDYLPSLRLLNKVARAMGYEVEIGFRYIASPEQPGQIPE